MLYTKGNPLPPSELERVRAALPAVTLNTDTPNEVYCTCKWTTASSLVANADKIELEGSASNDNSIAS